MRYEFAEERRLLGNKRTGFFSVLSVVETDANNLFRTRNERSETNGIGSDVRRFIAPFVGGIDDGANLGGKPLLEQGIYVVWRGHSESPRGGRRVKHAVIEFHSETNAVGRIYICESCVERCDLGIG